MPTITLPNQWQPRPYQENIWAALNEGCKRAVAVWPRRSGKDSVALHWTACAAMRRVGNYAFLLPLATQTRAAVWTSIDANSGRSRIDEAFPPQIVSRKVENMMSLTLVNGSTVTFAGSDNYSALIGTSFAGIVFDEWSLSDPLAWQFLRPILAENQGWALFIFTPRGRNHAWTTYDEASRDPSWFAEKLDSAQTGAFPESVLETELKELQRELGDEHGRSVYEQEFNCSFNAPLSGSYYGSEMERAETEGRICNVPHNPSLPTFVSWDLGIADESFLCLWQIVGKEIHMIDTIVGSGVGLDWYCRELQQTRYVLGGHILPHDVQVRELSTGKSRLDTLRSLGLANIRVMPATNISDGIQSVRALLPMVWFDQNKCKRAIEALRTYHRAWNETRKVFEDRPYHDQSSHACDSVRYYACANIRNPQKRDLVYSNKGIV